MTTWLKQSTAVDVSLGPFVDATDGVTAETGLTISQADIRLKKNGGAFAQTNNATGASHDENGYYEVPLDATDTNTLGILRVSVSESGALPVWRDFMVVPANVWDSFFGADKLQVHADEITAGLITAAAIATGAIDADAIAADAVTEIQSGLATSAALDTVDNFLDTEVAAILAAVDTEVAAIKAVTDLLPDAGALTSLATAAALDTVDNLLDTEVAAIKTVVDAVKAVTDLLPDAGALTSLATQASVTTIDDLLDTEVAAIKTVVDAVKAKTDNLPASPAATGDIPTATENADALLGRNISGGSSAGRTVKQALHLLRNKTSVATGTLTVYDTDDTTSSWTASVSTTAGDPISAVDPA